MKARRNRSLFTILSATAICAYTGQGRAQDTPREGEFSTERFEPAPGSKNFLGVERVRMEGTMGWTAGLVFDYARDPFVVASCRTPTDCEAPNALSPDDVHVIRDLFTWNLLASFTPVPVFQIGLRFPLTYVSGDGFDETTGGPSSDGLRAFAPGDPTLEGKFRLLGGLDKSYAVGGAVDVSAPLGHAAAEDKYIGSSSPITAGLRGILDFDFGPTSFALNLKGLWRTDAHLGTTTIGPEFRYGVGAGYRVSPVFNVLAEVFGATRFTTSGTNTLEADAAVQVAPLDWGMTFSLGGGLGIIDGVGAPTGRVIAGILYAHEAGDRDNDGIPDAVDQCPTLAEDFDGFEDSDGCPDDDNDGDKIPDVRDKCPNAKEILNGVDDEDGCPDSK